MIGRDTTILENLVDKKFPRLTYDEAVRIIKGEQDVNGKNAIISLEEELKLAQEKRAAIKAELTDREQKGTGAWMKKGELAFNQTKRANVRY